MRQATQRYQYKVYPTKRNIIMITTELVIHISISSWMILIIYSMNDSYYKPFADCKMFGITPRLSRTRCPQCFNWNSNNMVSITSYNVIYSRGGGRSNEDAYDSESYDEYDDAEDGDDDDDDENNNDDDEVDEDSLKRQIPDRTNVEVEEDSDVDDEDVEDDEVELTDNTKKYSEDDVEMDDDNIRSRDDYSNKNEVFGLESNEYDENEDITRSYSSYNRSQDTSSQDGATVMEGIVHLTYSTIESFSRLLGNVFRGETNDETVDDILRKLNRIWHGAFDSNPNNEKMIQIEQKQLAQNMQQNDDDVNEDNNSVLEKVTTATTKSNANSNVNNDDVSNFGISLAKSYNVMATRNDLENDSTDIIPILGGSFYDALKYARSKARLLVILIPAASPNNKYKADYDAITSFLSMEVATVAEGKAIKSKKNTKSSTNDAAQQVGIPQQKSFILWSAKAGSTEALTAIKRMNGIQTKNPKTNKERPILAVMYPAGQIDKVYPKLLSQHHCSPPPSSINMAGWLNSIRKRCLIQYTTMHTEIVEFELYKQRQQGYVGSIQADRQRQIREAHEEKERIKRDQIQQEYKEKIIQRRIELKQSLPLEPSLDETLSIVTIALRFADGRITTTPRRFISNSSLLSDIFNWIDVEYEIEREMIELLYTTKGQVKSFKWDDIDNIHKTLSDIGFTKMVALRVVVIATKEQKDTVTSTK